jgi:tetratricopeptide (TPR) repeat protein
MRVIRPAALLAVALSFLTSCTTDPNVAKQKYLASGNKYFDRGRYKEAAIMYKRALEKDRRFGPAYYKLALTDQKLNNVNGAVNDLRRAIELLPKTSPDHWDAVTRLSDIYLAVAHEKQYLDEVSQNIKDLLARDPNSYDAHRMSGDLNFIYAIQSAQRAERDQFKQQMQESMAQYNKANAIKPDQDAVLVQMARVAKYSGDFAGSEQHYTRAISKDKTLQTAYNELYQLYMIQGKKDEGEKLLKLAFQNNPKSYGFLTTLAYHYSIQNRRNDMVNVLQDIKSHSKDFPQAYRVVGDFYLRLGDPDSAIREFKEGMVKDPGKKAQYQKLVIEALMKQNKRAEAADLNAQILKENPNDSDARSLEASFLLDRGDVTRALSELQAVVTRSPDNPVARYNLGRAHAARGEWELARQSFQKAIELRPDYMLARLALAQLLVTRGDFDAALKSAQDILRMDRQNINARLIESAALLGQKKYEDAKDLLNSMLKVNPNAPDVLFQLGVVNLAEGKYKEADEAFKRTYELNPANSRGLMGMVETSMAQNHPDEALKLLESEAAKAPNRLDVQLALGNTEVRAGRYDRAIGYYQHVLNSLDQNSKTRGDLYLRIGETYRRKGDLANAITALQQARQLLPDNAIVLSTLALVLDTAGRWPEAEQVYQATIKIDPNNGVSLNNVAFLMAEHNGDLDQAMSLAVRAKQLLPNLAEVSDTLGLIYLKKKMNDDAIDIFKNLVAKVPAQATYHYHLGMAYLNKGDKAHAQTELTAALKYNPSDYERGRINELLPKVQ